MEPFSPPYRIGTSTDLRRARLIDTGVRSLRAIALEWGLDKGELSRLIGSACTSQANHDETALRLSHLLGIHRSLVALFGRSDARIRSWMQAANFSVPFNGSSPKHAILVGDQSRLGVIRSYLECQMVL